MKFRAAPILSLTIVLAGGCDGDSGQPSAIETSATPAQNEVAYSNRSELADEMRTAKARPRSASDGTGKAWIEEGPSTVAVGSHASWTIMYEAGGEGIAEQGRLIFMISPFWGWSTPQDHSEQAAGYTTVRTDAAGITLTTEGTGSPMMAIAVAGRGLQPGERIAIEYGGRSGARVDRYADARSRFWIGVDGDGDGTHRFLAESPSVTVEAGPPRQLVVIAPTTVHAEAAFDLRLTFLDHSASAGAAYTGTVQLVSEPEGLALPAEIEIGVVDRGNVGVSLRAPTQGVFRVRAKTSSGFEATSNPIVVTPSGSSRIYWGDLHGHSGLSDGTGTVEDYFRFARDVAGLDIVSLTDHDHWGVLHLDENPAIWRSIAEHTASFHVPGKFVTLLGYEWTSWEYGHRHVLYFSDRGDLYSSIDLDFNTPNELWDALRGRDVITVAHHSAGGPIATDWSYAPDPQLEPITEVVSVHGVSEAMDSPSVIYRPQPGNFVRDVLDRGYRFGFVGSGDSHDGHPGLAHLANGGTGGVAAIIASDLTRPAILEAIRNRRVYATSGPRIYLRAALSTYPMGAIVPHAKLRSEDGQVSLYVHSVGTDEITWLDVVRSGQVTRSSINKDRFEVLVPIDNPQPGEYFYVRIVQADGGLAWSSPIYVE